MIPLPQDSAQNLRTALFETHFLPSMGIWQALGSGPLSSASLVYIVSYRTPKHTVRPCLKKRFKRQTTTITKPCFLGQRNGKPTDKGAGYQAQGPEFNPGHTEGDNQLSGAVLFFLHMQEPCHPQNPARTARPRRPLSHLLSEQSLLCFGRQRKLRAGAQGSTAQSGN